jgi:hypothetical protein
MTQGKQQENWVILIIPAPKLEVKPKMIWVGISTNTLQRFWGNYKAYLNEQEFAAVNVPSESIMKVSC